MRDEDINYSIKAEGIKEQKKTFSVDYRQDLYAARQNGEVLQKTATAIEEHKIDKEMVPCLIVFFGHIKGIMPLPLSGFTNRNQLRKMIGQRIAFKVVKISRDSDRVILDRVQALKLMADVTWNELKKGKVRTAVVRKVHCKAAVVDLGGITVELPARECSWGFVNNLRDLLQIGDNLDVKITRVNKESKEIEVSARELMPNPWIDCTKRYVIGGEYIATVSGFIEKGVFCNLETGIDALTQRTKSNQVKVGDKVMIQVFKVDANKKQIRAKITRVL